MLAESIPSRVRTSDAGSKCSDSEQNGRSVARVLRSGKQAGELEGSSRPVRTLEEPDLGGG
jgi:hypothetical protein